MCNVQEVSAGRAPFLIPNLGPSFMSASVLCNLAPGRAWGISGGLGERRGALGSLRSLVYVVIPKAQKLPEQGVGSWAGWNGCRQGRGESGTTEERDVKQGLW